MRIRLQKQGELPEIIEFQKAKPAILGPITFDLPQWYERYTEAEQVKTLDYIGDIDGDTINVISVDVINNKENDTYCIIYSTQAKALNAYETLLRCGFLDTSRALAWSKVAKTGGHDNLYFIDTKRTCHI